MVIDQTGEERYPSAGGLERAVLADFDFQFFFPLRYLSIELQSYVLGFK